MKTEEMFEAFDIIDSLPEMDFYVPSLNELKAHNIEKNFDKYAIFLLFIVNEIDNIPKNELMSERNKELREIKSYISNLIDKYVVD